MWQSKDEGENDSNSNFQIQIMNFCQVRRDDAIPVTPGETTDSAKPADYLSEPAKIVSISLP